LPARSLSKTGRQSAVITAQTSPGLCVTTPSASASGVARVASITAVPCACLTHAGSAGRHALRMARLRVTQRGSSPTRMLKLRLANFPELTPPSRVVMSARTRLSAGQSGVIQSG